MKLTVLFGIVAFSLAAADVEVYKLNVVKPTPPLPSLVNPRIIGGVATTIERHPFTVQVLLNNALQCGGSILTPRHVLSAAHCFVESNSIISPRYFRVRAGTARLNSGGSVVSVSMIIVHERYSAVTHDNDVAVLLLASALRFSQSISYIGIPPQAFAVPDNSSVVHLGWGRTNPNINLPSEILQEVTVSTINRTICAQRYRQLQAATGLTMVVTDNMICAGLLDIGGKDACQGDSGGPLTYQYVLVGITSWGYGCADPQFPGVSARVSSYTTWINNTITKYNGATHLQGVPTFLLLAGLLTLVTRKLII
ncbi:trypsin CFT-1 [Aphomia sociella]